MALILVVAMAENRAIGKDGGLPWHLPADLKHFKAVTMGRPILMGRKTYDSIGRPLPGRRNIVITRNAGWSADGVEVAQSLDAAIAMAGEGDVMIVGGGQIYAEALPRADRLEITEVALKVDGDAFFPPVDKSVWHEVARDSHPVEDGKPAYAFVTYDRA
ncbi:MAG: dihydrofolate reductase [Alphaproteobacteria bacterium]|nr:MAG: dihydrofolate reductase [Alphaproteobacteria bacterium]